MTNDNSTFADLKIMPLMPSALASPSEHIPIDLVGAKILSIGTPLNDAGIEGGGLVIDYLPANSTERQRIIFGFSECGMWHVGRISL